MYCATWGTSSTSRRRVWSLDAIAASVASHVRWPPRPEVPCPVARRDQRAAAIPSASPPRDQDRPVCTAAQRPEIVVAGKRLDLEAGVGREVGELVCRHE